MFGFVLMVLGIRISGISEEELVERVRERLMFGKRREK